MMFGFVSFVVYLILLIASPIIAIRALFRRDYETPAVMVALYGYSVIGLLSSFPEFVQYVSVIYHIVWKGIDL